jgi:putative transcriptional regulator
MDPRNIEMLLQTRGERHPLFAGFAGWAPGQLESEMRRDGWYVLPASADLVFRSDTAGMWDELVRKARGRVATR